MAKIKRKLMAHYINAALTGSAAEYVRLGKDLEEFNTEMSANVEKKRNIIGETSVTIDSYEKSASVEPYYMDDSDPLTARIQAIIDEEQTMDDLKTTVLDVHLWEETGTANEFVAWREDAYIEVSSTGGDTTGYQSQFTIHHAGNRVKGKFNFVTKVFTPDSSTLGALRIEVISGGTATSTKVSDVIGETDESNLMYKLGGNSLTAPNFGDSTTGYTELTLGTAITVTSAQTRIVVIEKGSGDTVIATSPVTKVMTG